MKSFIGKEVENVTNEAILSSDKVFTSFMFNGHKIRFKTSPRLERYTKIVEWDNGYIDLIPILENLYFDVNSFLKPI